MKLIVSTIRDREPPGRFLKQDGSSKLWYNISTKNVLTKTKRALQYRETDRYKATSTSPSGNNNNEMSSLSSKTSLMKKAPPAAATTTMRKKAPPLTSNTFDDGTTTITTTTTTVPPQVDKTKSTRGPYQKKRKITEEENKSKVVRSYNTKSRGPRGPYQKKKAPPAAATTTMRKKAPPLTSTTFDDVAEEDNRTAKIIRDLDERIAVALADGKIRDDKKAETKRKRAEGNENRKRAEGNENKVRFYITKHNVMNVVSYSIKL